jgi:hypothetical protein
VLYNSTGGIGRRGWGLDFRTDKENRPDGACRVYHLALGVFLAALCGVPAALAGALVSYLMPETAWHVAAAAGLWAALGLLAARWAHGGYVELLLEASPRAGTDECLEGLREELPLYVAFVGTLALALAGGRAWLLGAGGTSFVLCALFLGLAALYSLVGFVRPVRERLYPEYPGLLGALLFAPGMVFFVAFYLAGP